MRKALSLLVVILMTASILQVGLMKPTTVKAAENTNGTFAAPRFVPVYFKRDGTMMEKMFPWQKAGEMVWGRPGYGMPDSRNATGLYYYVDPLNPNLTPHSQNEVNLPAIETAKQAVPVLWTEFYLNVNPAGGRSQESEHWYAVLDHVGQLWLDPDGRFNDPRYFEPADPTNVRGDYISEYCKNNPLARVDPSTGNNTQGPYVLDPENPRFNASVDNNGNTAIYFWDRNRTGRIFRMGWADMVDFYAGSTVTGVETYKAADKGTLDWDAEKRYPTVDFTYWGSPDDLYGPGQLNIIIGTSQNNWISPDTTTTNNSGAFWKHDSAFGAPQLQVATYLITPNRGHMWYFTSPISTLAPTLNQMWVNMGDELHTDNISGTGAGIVSEDKIEIMPVTDGVRWANVSPYDPGEFIYRKGFQVIALTNYANTRYVVEIGDTRLTPVSLYQNGETRNYPTNSVVRVNDWDLTLKPTLYRFPITNGFNADGARIAANEDYVHVDNQKTPKDFGWEAKWVSYQPYEWIYQELGGILPDQGFVTAASQTTLGIGDKRLSNVNNMVNLATLKKDVNRGFINADVNMFDVNKNQTLFVPTVMGDLLLLAEVLRGGCNEPAYNLSVETDVWEGMIPSVTSAAIRSPNNDVKTAAQTVQKNTVLDPDGSSFYIPATTFQNVSLKYREYIGVQIWKDDGIDNHIGINYIGTPPPPVDNLYPYNLSDDYRAGRTGEEFIGSSNGMYSEKDYGRNVLPFPADIMFFDAEPTAIPPGYVPQYGCGEAIYKNDNTVPSGLPQIVNEGDKRLSDVTVTIGNNVIKYKAGTTVASGDSDVNLPLTNFSATNLFFDKNWPNLDTPLNWTYNVGEEIYSIPTKRPTWSPTYFVADLDKVGSNYNFYTDFADPDDTTYASMIGSVVGSKKVLYLDLDRNGYTSPGDIRIYDLNKKYVAGSVMTWKDIDCLSGWKYIPASKAEFILNNAKTALYQDTDNSNHLNNVDIRLNRIYTYLPYTTVATGDLDLVDEDSTGNAAGSHLWMTQYISVFDTTNRNVVVYDQQPPIATIPGYMAGTIDDSDIWLTPYTTRNADTRLTSVTISDVTYACGSRIGDKMDMWVNENQVFGMSMGKNSNFRFIDWEVYPSAQIGLNVKQDKPFKVEQTSQIDVTVDPAPRAARWEEGVYYPPEKVYILIQNTEGPVPSKIFEDYKVVTADNPVATFQFTPYRGTCPPNGQYAGWRKVWDKTIKRTVLKDYDLRVRIVAIKDDGGVEDPVPQTYLLDPAGNTVSLPIVDPFWKMHTYGNTSKGNYDMGGQAKGNVALNPPRYQVPPFSEAMMNTFDCYGQKYFNVAAEDLKFISSKKCVGVLDQRFPNLSLRLQDADNPNDVNDPANLRLSVPNGNNVAVFYNAHNAGIDYLFTGVWVNKTTGKIDDWANKFIVQVNLDGTYLYWHWTDVTGTKYGMLDAGDSLYSPNTKWTASSGLPTTIPNYTLVKERPNFIDADCSLGKSNCTVCGDGFPELSKVSFGDRFADFFVTTYGVPTYMLNYGERTPTDEGGEIQLAVAPRDASTKLQVRVFTHDMLFDYNSTIKHPPYFIVDNKDPLYSFYYDTVFDSTDLASGLRKFDTMGIDYCGIKEYKVLPPDPYVNFVEMSTVDHALQNSQVNYTTGPSALSPLNVPTPQIQSPYQPLILDVGKDLRGYPGGQTHTGRVAGVVTAGGVTRTDQDHNGWNAYPAIWWWFWYENVDYNNFTDFNRLGTEFFPLTDYGLYFILKDIDGKHLSFAENTPIDYKLRRVEISGPFAQPRIFDDVKNTVTSDYEYNGLRHVPISYDWTGKVTIDPSNSNIYEHLWGSDWTNADRDGGTYRTTNKILVDNKQLNYTGLENVFRFEEFIPISYGKVMITVILWDGTKKIYQDCCAEPPTDGIDSHALDISSDKETLTADVDNKITITLKEHEVMQTVQPANDAFVYVWQDRGILNPRTKLYDGAGDGWVTNPPHSSDFSALAPQFFKEDDLNNDGKITFGDYETEVVGSYDMATNTWLGGVIDARTFQRNNGQYVFDLSEANGARINTVGWDFGGSKGDPDHVVSAFETLPVMVTAYKYGDDNNDRSFRPLYNFPGTTPQFSHEVYLSGQKFLDVVPMMDLSVSVQPNPLTAGVTPELVDPVSPLTFVITNEEGNPVDLTRGVADNIGNSIVQTDDVWNHLFNDIHPKQLPEYYWLRTDLQNDDGTRVSNRRLYSTPASPFQPINVDFALAKDGKYSFRGFCANDEGNFDVYIYTPDRKHAAKATVNVVLPTAEYSVVNTEDPSGTEFQVPGDPDFMLTAADNRLYRIRVTAKNAQGLMLKGVTKGVSTCGGGIKNTARFTPYSTRPGSFDFTEKDRYLFAEHFLQDLYPYTMNVGFDFNDNGKVDWRNAELFSLGAFTHTQNRIGQLTLGQVYYNTTLIKFDDESVKGGWDVVPNPNLVPPTTGWGLGAIYNSAHRGGYLFSDIDGDKHLTYHDSLGLDVNAQTTFYIFAEDLVFLGGLIGDNVYCNNPIQSDLAGYPPFYKTDPGTIYKRFVPTLTPDGVFYLDWEAFPNKEVQIAPPNLKVLDAKTRIELGKDLVNAANYDLVYATENHLIVEVRPADLRDLPMKEDGRVFMIGNQHQTAIYGHTKQSATDPKVMETTLHFTPTGLGENVAYLGYFNKNAYYLKAPYELKNTSTYTLRNLLNLDSVVGLKVEVVSDDNLHPNKTATITAKVTEIGTNAPVEGANVTVKGLGINASKKTGKDGLAVFDVTPNDKGIIIVTATMENRIIGTAEIRVVPDNSAPWLELDPLAPMTNKPQTEVTGRTNPGNTVTLNGSPAQVAQDGSFKGNVTLKEGLNTIVGEAKNAAGMTTRKMVTITLDTIPPNIFIDDPGYLVDITEIEVTGRVEPHSKVTVNGQPATVVNDLWKVITKVNHGKNAITVVAVDQAGNSNTATRDILVYKRTTIKLTLDNPVATLNGEPQPALEYPPFIMGGRTMVPIRFISEALGAKVEWDNATKGITITLDDKVISMQVGNTSVMVNGKTLTIDAPPVIKLGRTFVPLRFISEALGAKVEWDAGTRTVTVLMDRLS